MPIPLHEAHWSETTSWPQPWLSQAKLNWASSLASGLLQTRAARHKMKLPDLNQAKPNRTELD